MSDWHNESGRPLASDAWLDAHHKAKLPERRAFAELIAQRTPSRIVDLGCGPGLWLELLAEVVSADCELIGIDTDESTLSRARERSQRWAQRTTFLAADFESEQFLPEADVFLAFNVFPYVSNLESLLNRLRLKTRHGGCLVVRQYDGALLRIGPMDDTDRQVIDMSLMAAVSGSGQFKHYDLDRVFQSVAASGYSSKTIDFEVFRRIAPYPEEFLDYFANTMEWTTQYISDDARERLETWITNRGHAMSEHQSSSYFMEVDLVAWLS